jgi:hypothetical protein
MNASNSPSEIKPFPAPPTHAQVAALAHELWVERGEPRGSDIDIWLEAERQLTGHGGGAPSAVDPIPAELGSTDPDSDPAMETEVEEELRRFGGHSDQRSPTSFGV